MNPNTRFETAVFLIPSFKAHSQSDRLFSGKPSASVLFCFLPDRRLPRVGDAMGGGQARRAGSGGGRLLSRPLRDLGVPGPRANTCFRGLGAGDAQVRCGGLSSF